MKTANNYNLNNENIVFAKAQLEQDLFDLPSECVSELCDISMEEATMIIDEYNRVPIEIISSMCGISYNAAKEMLENYQNSEDKRAFVVGVAALLQYQDENNELVR